MLNVVKVSAGNCEVPIEGKQCGKPAAYKQILSASRRFLFCEEHASKAIKDAAKAAEKKAQAGR